MTKTEKIANMRSSERKEPYEKGEQIRTTWDELQWIVAQRLLSALTIPGFSQAVCKGSITKPLSVHVTRTERIVNVRFPVPKET